MFDQENKKMEIFLPGNGIIFHLEMRTGANNTPIHTLENTRCRIVVSFCQCLRYGTDPPL
jgi:hypothetical protein